MIPRRRSVHIPAVREFSIPHIRSTAILAVSRSYVVGDQLTGMDLAARSGAKGRRGRSCRREPVGSGTLDGQS